MVIVEIDEYILDKSKYNNSNFEVVEHDQNILHHEDFQHSQNMLGSLLEHRLHKKQLKIMSDSDIPNNYF